MQKLAMAWRTLAALSCLTLTNCKCCSGNCGGESPGGSGHVEIGNSSARACDLLFDFGDAGILIAAASFGQATRGSYAQREGALGVSCITRDDRSFEASPVSLAGPDGGSVSGLKLTKTTCYDRLGHPLADPQTTFSP